MAKEVQSEKWRRVFAEVADVRERLAKVEAHEENGKAQLEIIAAKLDSVSVTLHEIIGRESVRASIYGVIGSIISGVIVWLIALLKGS